MDTTLQILFELVGIFAIFLTAAALSLGYTEAEGADARAADRS